MISIFDMVLVVIEDISDTFSQSVLYLMKYDFM